MRKIGFAQAALFLGLIVTLLILIGWVDTQVSPEKMVPDYNQFRLTYSGIIEEIETNWSRYSQADQGEQFQALLQTRLEETKAQLLIYDIEHRNILFSNMTDIKKITAAQIQEYLYQDQSMSQLLHQDKYLVSYLLFNGEQVVGLSIFIVDENILLQSSEQMKTGIESGIWVAGGFLLFGLLIYFGIVYKRLTNPLLQLEIESKKIARGQLDNPISHELQSGALGGCFTELDRMRQDLKEMVEKNSTYEKGRKELINYLTHDLRTPIASMRALTEGLIDGIAATPEAKQQYLMGILRKTEEMERLTSDLFHHANIQLSGFHLEPVELYFDEMMENMMSSLEINLKTYSGTYEISHNHPHKLLSVDSFRLEQAVMNLVVNAIKYSPKGEKIRVSTDQSDDYMIIAVEDHGLGISKEDLPFIFENFYRGEKSRSRQYGGTGLGLSIVKYIAEAHGGYITVRSELSKGSVFKLYLPQL